MLFALLKIGIKPRTDKNIFLSADFLENLKQYQFCNVLRKIFVYYKWTILFFSSFLKNTEEMSDNELAELAKKDLNHLPDLIERYFDKIYQFFYFRIRNREDSEDLTADTFEKLLHKIHLFENKGTPFGAWLFKLAHNLLVDFLRKKRLPTQSFEDLEPRQEPSENFDFDAIDSELASAKIWEAIRELPKRQQEVWSLKLADFNNKEIAEMLKTSEENIRTIVHRSIKILKQKLMSIMGK